MCWCHSDIMKRIEEVPHAQFDKQIHEKLNFHGAKNAKYFTSKLTFHKKATQNLNLSYTTRF